MKKVRVRLGSNSYNICISPGLLAQTGRQLNKSGFSDKLVIITDTTVKSLHGNALKDSLAKEGFNVTILDVPEGEEQKSLETAGSLYHELSQCHAERNTPILALGGGVIGDLAGFMAATYMRGVPLIQIPTTLVAQGDSSIGGKVGLDHGQLKNKIGAFYQPKLVISDINSLKTLPPEQLTEGLAEVIKHAIIRDDKFFSYLEKNLDRIKSLDDGALEETVYQSARIKAEIVENDERDLGLRNILNCGHTVGHAIESVSDFDIRHGDAVAIGMVAEARMSNKMDILGENELTRIEAIIKRAGLPTEIPDLEVDKLIQAMEHDKKIVGGKIRFVLPGSIGKAFITDEVSPSLIGQALGK